MHVHRCSSPISSTTTNIVFLALFGQPALLALVVGGVWESLVLSRSTSLTRSPKNRIAIDGEKVIACCRGFFSSIRRTSRCIQQKRVVFGAMARVVPFLKPSAPVARKG